MLEALIIKTLQEIKLLEWGYEMQRDLGLREFEQNVLIYAKILKFKIYNL